MAGYVNSISFLNTNQATCAVTLTGVTHHDGLIADVFWASPTDTCTVTDTNGNTWTPIGSPKVGTGFPMNDVSVQQFYVLDANAGSTPVTATCTASESYIGLAVTEFSVATLPPAYDTNAYSAAASNGSSDTSASITPATNGEYIHSVNVVDNNVFGCNSPFTMRESGNFGENGVGDYLQTTAAPISCTWSDGGDNFYIMGIVAFKAGTGGSLTNTNGFFRLMR